jgi:Domain of unknown function (DUF6265)
MKKLIIILLMSIPFLSFSQSKEFGWLTGTWKMKNKSTYEVWKVSADKKIMEGISYQVKGADTLITEKLRIRNQNDVLYYSSDIAGDQPEIDFKITAHDANGFSSENPQHDFPKIIRYQLLSPTSMKAEIAGDGKVIPFVFDKIK